MEIERKEVAFFNIVAIIGAVLIFVGIAWLIAINWNQIPSMIKVLILVSAVLISFMSGVVLKEHESESAGRALITLGALLYILSVFLIAQIYNISTSIQANAWLLFLSWTIIMITAYFLDSKENLLVSLVVFFIWLISQYMASLIYSPNFWEEGLVLEIVLILLSAGSLLYGLTVFHKTINHKFTSMYRFWTVFYFLGIFYVLSLQTLLPILSEYTFIGETISTFLVSFVVLAFLVFVLTTFFAASKKSISFREVAVFIGIIALIFLLVFSTKIGAGLMGVCSPASCYNFNTESQCGIAPGKLACEWNQSISQCSEVNCPNIQTKAECSSVSTCTWNNELSGINNINGENIKASCERDWTVDNVDKNYNYQTCREFDNQKDECASNSECNWNPSMNISGKLPTTLWLLWILNNIIFLGFIILILWYGQSIGSRAIVNIGLVVFILDVITRYIGFWINLSGYFAFSILAILGGVILILGSWLIPRWRRKLLERVKQPEPENPTIT